MLNVLQLGSVNNCFDVKFVRNRQVVLHEKRIQLLMPLCSLVHPSSPSIEREPIASASETSWVSSGSNPNLGSIVLW